MTHYLGNDYYLGASLSEEKINEDKLLGKVARGNLEIPEDETLSEKEKK